MDVQKLLNSSEYQDKEVTVRGFLYQTPEGKWILSSEPNLKSCCVGSENKKMSQIFVIGDFSETMINRAVTIQGQFKENMIIDSQIVPSSQNLLIPTLLFFILVSIVIAYIKTRTFKKV